MRMLIVLAIILITLLTLLTNGQTSTITYDAGSSVDVGSNADVCADQIQINGSWSGSGTICLGALPVTMLSFTASVTNRVDIILTWQTGVELNNSGFDIERRIDKDGSSWEKTGFVQGSGTTNEPKSYTYTNKKLQTGTYKYRLKQIDYNGSYEYFELSSALTIHPPNTFALGQNYPNPSNPKSKIDYEIPLKGKVHISLYNLLGQEVLTLVNETKDAGYYTAEFDGSNLASGVYFYRLISEGFTSTKKMLLVK
jgi:Secretion system C-terminal sorting domain